jgi:hypothetical protein
MTLVDPDRLEFQTISTRIAFQKGFENLKVEKKRMDLIVELNVQAPGPARQPLSIYGIVRLLQQKNA